MLIADISTAFTDLITTETVVSARLNRFIAKAVDYYSRYNPLITSTTIDIVADTTLYNLPADCLTVISCHWWPMGELFAELRAGAELAFMLDRPARYHLISERIIDDIQQGAYLERVVGYWEQRNRTIYIAPEPNVADTDGLVLLYAAKHSLNDDSDGYDDIPDEDLGILTDLVVAEFLGSKSAEMVWEPDYSEGQSRVTKHFIPRYLREHITTLRNGVRDKYSVPAVAVG